jgi:hypothetical protein
MSRELGTVRGADVAPALAGGFRKSSSVTVHGLLLKLSRAWPLTANAAQPPAERKSWAPESEWPVWSAGSTGRRNRLAESFSGCFVV